MALLNVATLLSPVKWNTLAFLHRAGKPVNAAVLRSHLNLPPEELVELQERDLVEAARGNQPVDLHTQTFLPLIDITLTPAGRELGAQVVAAAGFLYWLSRRPGGRAPLRQAIDITGLDLDTVTRPGEHGHVEALTSENGGAHAVPVAQATACGRLFGVQVRITAVGRRYTTVTA